METFYIFVVVVLFLLAASDLVVGVANDAVNFLNSAVGSKVAGFKTIMIVAAFGILIGSIFAGGMMEVARKGVFNPGNFYFDEIMIIFLAVMITDVILLDGFNTLGLPTSTTVSIVFELLGAAVAISLLKISHDPNALPLAEYINTTKALAIISGILISVVVAFTVGAILQYIVRLIFTFDYDKKLKYIGAIFGGLSLSLIGYFIIFKGAKDASFIPAEVKDWIAGNISLMLLISFVFWTVLLQLLHLLFKFNILKFIVLAGTFSLAMAFSGNDLVNFIGVALAGLASFQNFFGSGATDPHAFQMTALSGQVPTHGYMLIIAGAIMVITLWTSKKARAVVRTSLDLSRQEEGEERFGSSALARGVVRGSLNSGKWLKNVLPDSVRAKIEKRFDASKYNSRVAAMTNPPAFDLLRAANNLVVASTLIAFATSLKLPLSTTYVTFMVAMGTSLADQAWGRDSAVYRITGVFSVIGGWFLTAIVAFLVSAIMATIIYFSGSVGIVLLIALAIFMVVRTQRYFNKKEKTEEVETKRKVLDFGLMDRDELMKQCNSEVAGFITDFSRVLSSSVSALLSEDRKQLDEDLAESTGLHGRAKRLRKTSYHRLRLLEENSIDSGLHYIQVVDYLREMVHAVQYIVEPASVHVSNNHKPFTDSQKAEISEYIQQVERYLKLCASSILVSDFSNITEIINQHNQLNDINAELVKGQLKRLKSEKGSTKVSVLYLNIMQETKNMILDGLKLVKAQRDFVN